MTAVDSTAPKLGLRERKKLKTREAIQREAMRLFTKQGYEETTIEQIAAAADISEGTFFNYFPTKEDVVLYDAFDPMIGQMLVARPPDEDLGTAVRHVLDAIAQLMESDHATVYARSKLSLEVPELRARLWEEFEKAQFFLGGLIAQRAGRQPDDFEIRIVVMAFVAAMMEATREWVRTDGRASIRELLRRAYEIVDGDGRLAALAPGK